MKKPILEKVETHYRALLEASEYDFLEVIVDVHGRLTIKFLDSRWRTAEEAIEVLKEIIQLLSTADFSK